ncbi:hypothetical protein YC2023_106407 [Brassica napus]
MIWKIAPSLCSFFFLLENTFVFILSNGNRIKAGNFDPFIEFHAAFVPDSSKSFLLIHIAKIHHDLHRIHSF